MKKTWLLSLFILSILLVSCSPPARERECSKCPSPSAWSECDGTGNKTRVNYECTDNSGYTCIGFQEKSPCQMAIVMSGSRNLNAQVTPARDDLLEGIVKIDVSSLPGEANKVWVMLTPQGWQPKQGENPANSKNVIMQIVDAKVGETIWIETKKVANGVYNLAVLATSNPNGAPWSDVAQKQVVIKNSN